MRRVFVDAHIFDEKFQGSRTFLKGLYAAVLEKESNFEFYFGVSDVENFIKEFLPLKNFRVIKYRFRNSYFRLLLDIPFILLRHKIHIAHFTYISPFFRVTKEVVTMHDVIFLENPEFFSWWYVNLKSFFFGRAARRADLVTTISTFSKNSIERHFGIDSNKIALIVIGIPPGSQNKDLSQVIADFRLKHDIDKYLLFVSRIEPRKNHLLLVKSYVQLKLWERGFRLLFVGSFDLPYPDLDNFLQALQSEIRKNIFFLKDISTVELAALYTYCDLFIYPSFVEGFGIPPLEAIVAGATTLCSERTAMADYSFLGDKLFNPGNLDELSTKIDKYLSLPKEYKRIDGEREFVLQKYNWSNIADEFLDAIDRLP